MLDSKLVLTNIILGALGGYITNERAVKMIFEKWLGMGGIIINTRKEFAENMSNLVEQDIINAQTLRPALDTPAFQAAFAKLQSDFWSKELPILLQEATLKDIPGTAPALEAILEFYRQNAPEFIEESLTALADGMDCAKLLPPDQLRTFIDKLFTILLQETAFDKTLHNLLAEFAEQLDAQTCAKLIGATTWAQLQNNFLDILAQIQQYLQKNVTEQQLNTFMRHIAAQLKAQELFATWLQTFRAYTLAELLGPEQSLTTRTKLAQQLCALVDSPDGQSCLLQISRLLLSDLAAVDKSLADLLPHHSIVGLKQYLRRNLPERLELLTAQLVKHRTEVNLTVDNAIDRALNEQSGPLSSLQNYIKRRIRNSLYQSISDEYHLPEQLAAYLRNPEQQADVAASLLQELFQLLHKQKLGAIVQLAIRKDLLTENTLAALLTKLIKTQLEPALRKISETPLRIVIDSLGSEQLFNVILNNLAALIYLRLSQIDQASVIQSVTTNTGQIRAILRSQQSINSLHKVLQAKHSDASAVLAARITSQLQALKVSAVLDPATQNRAVSSLSACSEALLSDCLHNFQNQSPALICNNLRFSVDSTALIKTFSHTLGNSAELTLRRQIKATVSSNLRGLSDQELQLMVKNFMGRELSSINLAGSLLGGVAGGAFALSGGGTMFAAPALNLAANSLLYALIGWGTNKAAVKMIFRPYRPWKLGHYTLPLTPGVIPREQPNVAANMADFIQQRLLVEHSAAQSFLENRSNIRQYWLNVLSRDNYAVMRLNPSLVQPKLCSLLNLRLDQAFATQQSSLQKPLQNYLSALHLNISDYALLRQQNQQLYASLAQCGAVWATKQTRLLLRQNTILTQLLPNHRSKLLLTGLNQINRHIFDNIITGLHNYTPAALDSLLVKYSDKTCSELLPNALRTTLRTALQNYLHTALQNKTNLTILSAALLPPKGQAAATYAPMLRRILLKHSDTVISSLLKKFLIAAAEQQEPLSAKVYRHLQSSLSTSQMLLADLLNIRLTIRRTTEILLSEDLPQFVQTHERTLQAAFTRQLRNQNLPFGLFIPEPSTVAKLLRQLLRSGTTDKLLLHLQPLLENALLKIRPLALWRHLQSDFKSIVKQRPHLSPTVLLSKISVRLCHQRLSIIRIMTHSIAPLLTQSLRITKAHVLLNNISDTQITTAYKHLLQAFFNTPTAKKNLSTLSAEFNDKVSRKPLAALLNTEQLATDMLAEVRTALQVKTSRNKLNSAISHAVNKILENVDVLLPTVLKQYTATKITTAAVNALAVNFTALLQALDIRSIAHRQILNMSPQKLELMFEGFAGRYFRKIEFYGVLAGILGLLTAPLLALLTR